MHKEKRKRIGAAIKEMKDKGKPVPLDMHNDTAYAAKGIRLLAEAGLKMITPKSSLEMFLRDASPEEKAVYRKYKDKIRVVGIKINIERKK